MYAIIEAGSKQYKVKKDDIIDIELVDSPKDEIKLEHVVLFHDGEKMEVGSPYLKGAHVSAKVLGTVRDKKVTTFKYKSKINYHRTIGHKQKHTRIQITGIHAK